MCFEIISLKMYFSLNLVFKLFFILNFISQERMCRLFIQFESSVYTSEDLINIFASV